MITAVGQFQRDIQNELTVEGIAAAEAEGRYRGRPPALAGSRLEEVRSALTGLLPGQPGPPVLIPTEGPVQASS